jgi:Zn-finger protein
VTLNLGKFLSIRKLFHQVHTNVERIKNKSHAHTPCGLANIHDFDFLCTFCYCTHYVLCNFNWKNVSRNRKKTFYLQHCMRFFDGSTLNHKKKIKTQKKYVSSEKEPKIRIGATWGMLQARPQKMIDTPNQPIRTKFIPKKVCSIP